MERIDVLPGSNAHLRKDHEDFAKKHGKDGDGIRFKLREQEGTLFPTGGFAPYHSAFFIPCVEPPAEEWKRKQLIFKYYETRAARAQQAFESLKEKLAQQAKWAEEYAGQPNAVMPPQEPQIKELRVLQGVAKRFIAEFERKREELGDIRDPREAAREAEIQGIREWANRAHDAICEIQL